MKVKGIAHVHSHFSDGLLGLPEIKERARALGADFVLVADHFPLRESFRKMQGECQELSDKKFLFIPGIEINSQEGYHFLVYNPSDLSSLPEKRRGEKFSFPEICANFLSRESLFVLAHSSLYRRLPSPDILEKLDGLEVWNPKYDSRFAPNVKSLKRALAGNLIPFAGVDAHGPAGLKSLWLEMEVGALGKEELFNVLKQGAFRACTPVLSLNLKEELSRSEAFTFNLTNKFYTSLRYPFALLVRSRMSCPGAFIKVLQKLYCEINLWSRPN